MLVGDLPDNDGYARRLEEMPLRERLAEVVCHRGDVEGSYQQLLAVVAGDRTR